MNIRQLISSTGKVPSVDPVKYGYNRGQDRVFEKPFGEMYLFNKTVKTKKGSPVIEVSMLIKAKTELGAGYHKVSMAINGVENKHYSASELVRIIRFSHPEYKEMKDEEILDIAVSGQVKIFNNKTVFEDTEGEGYNVIGDQIPYDSEIRVWCSCSDYYWTFQYYNVENGVDIIQRYPDRYVPKTKRGYEAFKSNKPLRNPGRRPGMCKHLMLLIASLMGDKVIQTTEVTNKGTSLLNSFTAKYKEFEKSNRLDRSAYDAKMKEYEKRHRSILGDRRLSRYEYGYGSSIGSKFTGWDKKSQQYNSTKNKWENK